MISNNIIKLNLLIISLLYIDINRIFSWLEKVKYFNKKTNTTYIWLWENTKLYLVLGKIEGNKMEIKVEGK